MNTKDKNKEKEIERVMEADSLDRVAREGDM